MVGARKRLVALALCIASARVLAGDQYLVFGGGGDPESSQVSIEQNVAWIQARLQSRDFTAGAVLFGGGPEGTTDVLWRAEADVEVAFWRPFSRLSPQWKQGALMSRGNTIEQNLGPATRDGVLTVIERAVDALDSGDRLFLTYAGHGSLKPGDTNGNAMRLWGHTFVNVREMGNELRKLPAGANVQFILPQCYSGSFVRSIFGNPDAPALASVTGNICGFVSVSDVVESEGCTTGIDSGDYRDYASYMLGALTGTTRSGGTLARVVDLNRDGSVGLDEAHVDTFVHAPSTDVPRSTSDAYLEAWEPWYLRFRAGLATSRNNPYRPMIEGLVSRLGLGQAGSSLSPGDLAATAYAHRRVRAAAVADWVSKLDMARTDEKDLRTRLKQDFDLRWPGLDGALGARHARLFNANAPAARSWLVSRTEYAELATKQTYVDSLEKNLLHSRRQLAAYERLDRALRLASLYEAFEHHAGKATQARYRALKQCEAQALPRAIAP